MRYNITLFLIDENALPQNNNIVNNSVTMMTEVTGLTHRDTNEPTKGLSLPRQTFTGSKIEISKVCLSKSTEKAGCKVSVDDGKVAMTSAALGLDEES